MLVKLKIIFISANNFILDERRVEHGFISGYSFHIKSLLEYFKKRLTPTQILRFIRVYLRFFESLLSGFTVEPLKSHYGCLIIDVRDVC